MSNSKLPRVSVKIPGKERGVAVTVKPPESRLYLMVTSEGEALEVKVSPEGLSVEVTVLPLEGDDPQAIGDFPDPTVPTPGPPGPPPQGPLAVPPAKPDSSFIVVESGDLDVFKEISGSSATFLAMKLSEPSAELLAHETPTETDFGLQSELPPPGLPADEGGLPQDLPTPPAEEPFTPPGFLGPSTRVPIDPSSSGLLKYTQTQALLAQLPDLEPTPPADDDSRSGTAQNTYVPPGPEPAAAPEPADPGYALDDPGQSPLPERSLESGIADIIARYLPSGGMAFPIPQGPDPEGSPDAEAASPGGPQPGPQIPQGQPGQAPTETFFCEPIDPASTGVPGQAAEPEQAREPEPEPAGDLEDEPAWDLESAGDLEAAGEPAPEQASEPEPEAEPEPEPEAEAMGEPEPTDALEAAGEPEPEPASEPEPEPEAEGMGALEAAGEPSPEPASEPEAEAMGALEAAGEPEPGPAGGAVVVNGYHFDPNAMDELDDETPAVFETPEAEPGEMAEPGELSETPGPAELAGGEDEAEASEMAGLGEMPEAGEMPEPAEMAVCEDEAEASEMAGLGEMPEAGEMPEMAGGEDEAETGDIPEPAEAAESPEPAGLAGGEDLAEPSDIPEPAGIAGSDEPAGLSKASEPGELGDLGEGSENGFDLAGPGDPLAGLDDPDYDPVNDPAGTRAKTLPLTFVGAGEEA
ncbi:MAG: hypothetical protein LBF58_00610, partial [Deltaproteobacteria bacterium]|nr:hypothetical protein [Deltaproteobacteria bacterium]